MRLLLRGLAGAKALVLYRGILRDPAVQALMRLLDVLLKSEISDGQEGLPAAYAEFFEALASVEETRRTPLVGSPWQNHLLNLILADSNVFSRRAESETATQFGRSLVDQVQQDLSRLQALHGLEPRALLDALNQGAPGQNWCTWDEFSQPVRSEQPSDRTTALKRYLTASQDWPDCWNLLAQYYRDNGTGIFGQYQALRWSRTRAGGSIQPIENPDLVELGDLLGCDEQKDWLIRNTRYFLSDLPANNVFVYGDRGTGKSSAVKGLLHEFRESSLRMIEISRDDLIDLPEVMRRLRGRRQHFILFIDDLSFEEGETQYKTLKAFLEGSLEAHPQNVLVYATSNRRHLIKEFFADRGDFQGEEVRGQDSLQEKVSLADRFGIQLVFVSPDQEQYLEIVRSIAKQRDLDVDPHELKLRALRWAQLHNGRSGRTARQFVDFLTGELKIG
ncbi:MAG: ATP-binding protein [Acidobacteriota bacterium]